MYAYVLHMELSRIKKSNNKIIIKNRSTHTHKREQDNEVSDAFTTLCFLFVETM